MVNLVGWGVQVDQLGVSITGRPRPQGVPRVDQGNDVRVSNAKPKESAGESCVSVVYSVRSTMLLWSRIRFFVYG